MLRNFILEFCLIFCGKILYFVTAARNFNLMSQQNQVASWGVRVKLSRRILKLL